MVGGGSVVKAGEAVDKALLTLYQRFHLLSPVMGPLHHSGEPPPRHPELQPKRCPPLLAASLRAYLRDGATHLDRPRHEPIVTYRSSVHQWPADDGRLLGEETTVAQALRHYIPACPYNMVRMIYMVHISLSIFPPSLPGALSEALI
jgi:hypothetical protein